MDNGKKKQSFFGYTFNDLMDVKVFGYTLREVALFGTYPVLKTGAVWPTQPLAKIAGVQQASVMKEEKPLNFVQAAKRVASTPGKGMAAFWDASVASANRMFVQSLYKGPLQVFAGDISKKMVPENISGLHFFRGLIAGSFVGVTDPMILGPLERYKTWKLLQEGKSENFIGYIKSICKQQNNNLSGVIKELYRGVGVTIVKQSMMNGTLFITKGFATDFVKPHEKKHPIASMAFSSIIPGMAAAGVGAPTDLIKSLIQQHTGKNLTVKELFEATIKKSGWKGLFTGLPAKFVLIASGYTVNALFLNLFEKYRKADESDRNEPPSQQSPKGPSAAFMMEQTCQNAAQISPEEEKLIAQCAPYVADVLAECLAESYYDSLSSQEVIRTLTGVVQYHHEVSSAKLKAFTLQELIDLSEEELKSIPADELALRMPPGGIMALLARVVISYENLKILDELGQFSSEQLAHFSEEELEQFHAQFFGALLNNPPQTSENTPEKRMLKRLMQQLEALNINEEMQASDISCSQKSSLLFASKQQGESDANYFSRLAQRAGDECHNNPFDLSQEESDVESKKRTLSME